jgi:hypothetical protein
MAFQLVPNFSCLELQDMKQVRQERFPLHIWAIRKWFVEEKNKINIFCHQFTQFVIPEPQ